MLMFEHDARKLYVYESPGCAVVSSPAGSPSAVFVLSMAIVFVGSGVSRITKPGSLVVVVAPSVAGASSMGAVVSVGGLAGGSVPIAVVDGSEVSAAGSGAVVAGGVVVEVGASVVTAVVEYRRLVHAGAHLTAAVTA